MILKKIVLTNFKNYEYQKLDLSTGLNCFVGQNGSGKTNLLDAIYYLCMCKSYFSMPDSAIIRKSTDFFRLEGQFENNKDKETIVAKNRQRTKKVIERNGVPYQKLSDHVGFIPVVMIAPDDTSLAKEGSEERRKFINNTLSQLDNQYLSNLIRYNKVLSHRNAALKQFGKTGKVDYRLIDTYDSQMIAPAAYIHQMRKDFVMTLQPLLYHHYAVISSEREAISCMYKSALNEMPFEDILLRSREKDVLLQRSTAGIHKDDLVFKINDDPIKRFGSQGQLKSFVLSLKLAQFDLIREGCGKPPLLLLDDIFDKLDEKRVKQLLTLLQDGNFKQVFITDTHEERVKTILGNFSKASLVFRVTAGTAKPT
ncbi:MAG: DNA replication/repair protein RecF [Bacteroidota bacterium]